jgi:hypothetical protein
MTRTWIRGLAAPGAVALTLGVCAAGTAQAQPVEYRCSTMSIIFYVPWQDNLVIASGCEGPVGEFRHVIFKDPPPYSAGFCTWTYAYETGDGADLHVNGHSCS